MLLCKKLAEHPKAFPANLWELLPHKVRAGSSVTIQLVLAQEVENINKTSLFDTKSLTERKLEMTCKSHDYWLFP